MLPAAAQSFPLLGCHRLLAPRAAQRERALVTGRPSLAPRHARTPQLIMKSVRNRELQQQQRQFNPHLSTYQRARPFTDGLLYGTGAVTHVLNPSGTTSFTSAQKRIPDDAEEHADERALGSPATSGIGSGGSKETGAGTGGTGTGTPAGSDTGDADCTSGGSPPGPAGSEEPQPIGGDPPPRDMDDE